MCQMFFNSYWGNERPNQWLDFLKAWNHTLGCFSSGIRAKSSLKQSCLSTSAVVQINKPQHHLLQPIDLLPWLQLPWESRRSLWHLESIPDFTNVFCVMLFSTSLLLGYDANILKRILNDLSSCPFFVAKFKINLVFSPPKIMLHCEAIWTIWGIFFSSTLKLLFMEIFKKMIYIPALKKGERKLQEL